MFLPRKETNLKNGPVQSRTILYMTIVSDGDKKELLGNMCRMQGNEKGDCYLFLSDFSQLNKESFADPLRPVLGFHV